MEELLCRWKNYNDYPKILQRFLEEQHINCRNWKSEAITNALEKAIVYEFENDPNIEPQNYLSTLLFEKSVLEGAADRVDMTMFISDIPIFLTTWLEECKHRSYQDSKWFGITNIVLGFIMKTCHFYSMGKTSLRGPYKIMFDMIIEEKLNTTHTIAVAGYLNDCLNKRSIKLAQPMSIVLHPYAIKIAQIITTCGDHIGQLTLSSLLFQLFVRMYSQKKRSSVAEEVFAGPNFQESVRNIVRRRVFSCVEGNQDCREFLNAMNEVYGKVVSLSCGQAYICSSIVYTQESNQGQLWVDFNTDTQRITFTLPRSLPCREDTVSSTTCMDKETIPVSVDFSTITALYLSLESNHAELSINLNAFPKLLELHESIVDKLKGQKNWELLFILLKTSQIKMLYSTILMDFKEKYHGPSMKSIEGWIYSKSDGNDGMNEGLISQCTATPNQKIPFNSEFSMSNEDRGLCPSIKKASLWHLSLPLLQIMSVTRNPSDGESINSISTTGSNLKELRNVLNQPVPDESNKLTAETPIKEAVVATKVARRISSRRNTLAASLQENLELECEASDTECLAKQTKQIERKKSTPPLPDTTNSPETMRALLNIGTSPVKEAMQSKTKPKLVIKKSPGRPCNRRTKITTAEDKAGPQADERAVENVADVIAKKRTQKSAQSKTPKPEMHRKTTPDPYDPYQKEEYTAFEEEVDQRPKSSTGKRFFPEGLKNGIPQGYGPKRSTTPAKKQDVKKKATESSTKTRLAGKRTNGKRRELYMPSKEQTLCVSPDNSFSSGEFNPCHNLLIKRASMERGNKQAALNTIKRAKKTKPSESQHNSDNESDFSPSTSHHFINQDCSANMSQPGLMKEKRKSTRIRPKIDYRELNDSTSSAKMGDTSEHASQGVPDKTSITDDNILMPPPGGKGVQKIRGKRLDGNTKLPVSSSCQPSRAEDQNSSLEKTFNFRDTVTFNVNMSPDETNKISYDSPERMRKPSALPAFKSRESLCAAHSGSPPQLLPQDSVPKECVSAELPMKAAIKKTKKPKKNLIPKGGKVFRSSDDEAFSFPLDIEITDPKKAKVDLISNDLSCGLNEIRRSPSPDESPTRDPAVVAEEADRSCTSSPILENRTKYVSRDSSQHSSLTSDKAISEQQQSLTQRSRISTPSLESDGDITFGSVSPIQQASTIEQKNQVNNQAGREASVANETYLEDATPTASGSSQNSFREEAAEAEYVNMTRCRRSNGDNGASKKKTMIMQKGAYIDGRLGYTAPKPQKSQPPKKRNTPLLLPCRPKDKKKMNLKFRVRSHNSNNKFGAVVKILQRMSFKRTKIGAFIKWLKSENDVAELVLLFINKICSSKERGQIMNGLDECRRYVMRRSGRILESDDSLGEESDDSS